MTMSTIGTAKPNVDDRVVQLLRSLLARAEAGELRGFALAGEMTGREVVTSTAGDFDVFRVLGALDILKARMIAGVEER